MNHTVVFILDLYEKSKLKFYYNIHEITKPNINFKLIKTPSLS
jgi:hypothetical protein